MPGMIISLLVGSYCLLDTFPFPSRSDTGVRVGGIHLLWFEFLRTRVGGLQQSLQAPFITDGEKETSLQGD